MKRRVGKALVHASHESSSGPRVHLMNLDKMIIMIVFCTKFISVNSYPNLILFSLVDRPIFGRIP